MNFHQQQLFSWQKLKLRNNVGQMGKIGNLIQTVRDLTQRSINPEPLIIEREDVDLVVSNDAAQRIAQLEVTKNRIRAESTQLSWYEQRAELIKAGAEHLQQLYLIPENIGKIIGRRRFIGHKQQNVTLKQGLLNRKTVNTCVPATILNTFRLFNVNPDISKYDDATLEQYMIERMGHTPTTPIFDNRGNCTQSIGRIQDRLEANGLFSAVIENQIDSPPFSLEDSISSLLNGSAIIYITGNHARLIFGAHLRRDDIYFQVADPMPNAASVTEISLTEMVRDFSTPNRAPQTTLIEVSEPVYINFEPSQE